MIWLTWRQFRMQVVAVYVAVAAIAASLVVNGSRLHSYRSATAPLYDQLSGTDRTLYYAGLVVMALAPALIGAFWGAPMVARELEAGTHRLVWNQSVTRARWLATKLLLTGFAAALAVGALTLVMTWWAAPLDGATGSQQGSLPTRLTPVAFAMRGMVPAAYTAFAFVLGVTAGIVLRRAVVAMAVTLVLFTLVQVAVPLWVRPHLLPPTTRSIALTQRTVVDIEEVGPGQPVTLGVTTGNPGDWVLSNDTVGTAGQVVKALPAWLSACVMPPLPAGSSSNGSAGRAAAPPIEPCLDRLTAAGYHQRVVYQPAARFWSLQWAESGLFLALTALLTWVCFWWMRRRLT